MNISEQVEIIKIVCFTSDKLAKEEELYIQDLTDFRNTLGIFSEDLIVIITILRSIKESPKDIDTFVNNLNEIDRQKKDRSLYSKQEIEYYNAKSKIPNILSKISEYGKIEDIQRYANSLVFMYGSEIQSFMRDKNNLVNASISVINFKEKQLLGM